MGVLAFVRGVDDDAARFAAAPFAAAFDAACFFDRVAPEVEDDDDVAAALLDFFADFLLDVLLDCFAVPPAAFLAATFLVAAFVIAFLAGVFLAVERFDAVDFFLAAAIAVAPPGRT